MPELPEVETVARTLRPHICGHIIKTANLLRPRSLHPLSLPLASLPGCCIAGTRRRGKLLILDLSPPAQVGNFPAMLIAHLRMTGRLLVKSNTTEPGKHTRCYFDLDGSDSSKNRLFFDDTRAFGQLFVCTPELLQKWPFWRDLGPEPLAMTPGDLQRQLSGSRPLKLALLDQRVIAGIGNIYADEALFGASLSPERSANSLSAKEVAALLEAIRSVLTLSIAQCGSSIRDYRDADGNAGAFQNSFKAYGRGGKPCLRCGEIMHKTRLGGRATVFCPHCQK